MDKKMIDVDVSTVYVGDLEGEVLEVTKRLLEICQPGDRLEWERGDSYHNETGCFRVLRQRLETDEECDLRVAKEQAELDRWRKVELAQLERLKKKYENG